MKKLLIHTLLVFFALSSFGQTTSVFNTTANQNSAIGTTTLSTYSGYTGLTLNNATNGGFLDFKNNNSLRANIYGDNYGLTLAATTGYPIHFLSNNAENMTLLSNGNLGIGTTAALAKLHVNGTFLAAGTIANLGTANLSFLQNTGLTLMGWNASAGDGESDFISNRGPGAVGGFAFYDYANSGTTPQTELMRIRGNGQVFIGVSNYSSFATLAANIKLAVGGGIETESVLVKTQANWPDYVLKNDYKLLPLDQVESYIEKNHHLSEMPSEEDIKTNGQDLGEMNALLLKKVEELTLYIIDQEKEIKIQEARIQHLETLVKDK